MVQLHFLSDLMIGVAYVAISATLLYLVRRGRRDIPFHWMFLSFGAFIIACGGTHFMEVWTPVYWLAGMAHQPAGMIKRAIQASRPTGS